MKIAMPYQDGVLLEHFGRAKEFIIYNVSDLDPVTSEVIAPADLSHAAVARALKEHGVDVVLCGSIGEHARQAVEGEHMLVFSGITGAADDVLERFLQGNLGAVDGDFAARGQLRRLRRRLCLRRVRRLLRRAAELSASPTSKRAPLPTL
ncbi:MAG: NifB/NifX family molybdenum-iron cluster-binding protein [Oscillospiraceae bacterium]